MQTMPILIAALGGVSQEVVYWYDLRTKLAVQKYRDLMGSGGYWLITAAMIVVSALGTAAWFAGEAQPLRTYLIAGAAFPLLLKKGISAFLAPRNKLGAPPSSIASTYFREA